MYGPGIMQKLNESNVSSKEHRFQVGFICLEKLFRLARHTLDKLARKKKHGVYEVSCYHVFCWAENVTELENALKVENKMILNHSYLIDSTGEAVVTISLPRS